MACPNVHAGGKKHHIACTAWRHKSDARKVLSASGINTAIWPLSIGLCHCQALSVDFRASLSVDDITIMELTSNYPVLPITYILWLAHRVWHAHANVYLRVEASANARRFR